jgi:hypothetical protein
MELFILLTLLPLLGPAALRWGCDSRDPHRGITGAGDLLPREDA